MANLVYGEASERTSLQRASSFFYARQANSTAVSPRNKEQVESCSGIDFLQNVSDVAVTSLLKSQPAAIVEDSSTMAPITTIDAKRKPLEYTRSLIQRNQIPSTPSTVKFDNIEVVVVQTFVEGLEQLNGARFHFWWWKTKRTLFIEWPGIAPMHDAITSYFMENLAESLNDNLGNDKSVTKWYTQANGTKIEGVGWFTLDGNIKAADSDLCVFIYEFANTQTHRDVLKVIRTHFTTPQNITIMGAVVFNLEETSHTVGRNSNLAATFKKTSYSKAELIQLLADSGGWGPVDVHGQRFLGKISLTAEVLHRFFPEQSIEIDLVPGCKSKNKFQSYADDVNEALSMILLDIKQILCTPESSATASSNIRIPVNSNAPLQPPIDWNHIVTLFQDGVVSTLLTRINDAYPENHNAALETKKSAVESVTGAGFQNVWQRQKRRREEEQEEGSSQESQRTV
ncbi:hypothetical protein CERSUDRAFT_71993 [Gelatoporia subvermispora B]|uniref:Uncharacterized protein n=1 Tax=Ceriporiopsis subvermispora (strain B) TaxID=914234 RepID=M2PU08_CERS8|nr:hypothetical protein CERSUDRAFT_71993 [Gelatoporia subvermispora B]